MARGRRVDGGRRGGGRRRRTQRGAWESGNAQEGQEGGLAGGVRGQFVIKLKIPSAEEADERVTNGRDRNGSSSTGRRHATTDKRRTRGTFPSPRVSRRRAARYLTSTVSFSCPIFLFSTPLVHDHPRSLGFPWGAVGADGGRRRVKSSCEQFSIAETPLETRARASKRV